MKNGFLQNIMEHTGRRASIIAGLLLLSIWAVGSIDGLMAELDALKKAPELLKMSYEEKKLCSTAPYTGLPIMLCT